MENPPYTVIDDNDPSVGRILIVDGDPYARISCRAHLCGGEFIVFTEEDKERAYKRLLQEQFDLVIMDIRLPDVHGGLTFLQDVKGIRPKTDVVLTAERPSIWDAREAIKLGALKYLEKPFSPEFTMNVVKRVFDKRGWVVRKNHIDHFRDCLKGCPESENPVIFYKEGSWARHLYGRVWEVGYDMRYWLPSGCYKNEACARDVEESFQSVGHEGNPRLLCENTLSLRVANGLSTLSAGKPYAKVTSDSGGTYTLRAPMTGKVCDVNTKAADIMLSCMPEDRGADWLLWLARIQAPGGQGVSIQDMDREEHYMTEAFAFA